MEKTGVFREIDKLCRIVILMEIRKTLDIKEGSALEFSIKDGVILLRPLSKSCVICGSECDVADFGDKHICRSCIEKLKRIY